MTLTEDIEKLKTVADNVYVDGQAIRLTVNGQKCRCLISRLDNRPFNFTFWKLEEFAAALFGTDPKLTSSAACVAIAPHMEDVKLHGTEGSLIVVVDFHLHGVPLSMQMDPENVGAYCVEIDSLEDFINLVEWAGDIEKQETDDECQTGEQKEPDAL